MPESVKRAARGKVERGMVCRRCEKSPRLVSTCQRTWITFIRAHAQLSSGADPIVTVGFTSRACRIRTSAKIDNTLFVSTLTPTFPPCAWSRMCP